MPVKDTSSDNRAKIVADKLIAASRKMVQSATPAEALDVWKLLKTQQLKRIAGLTETQIQTLVETQAREIGADCLAVEVKQVEAELSPITTDRLADEAVAVTANGRAKASK